MGGYRRSEIVSGGFVVIAAAMLTWLAFRAGGMTSLAIFGPRSIKCISEFSDVQGLTVGAWVMAAGRPVGDVTGIRLVESPITDEENRRIVERLGDPALAPPVGALRTAVEVRFSLRDATLRFDPATATVRIGQSGLLGETLLTLDSGYWMQQRPPLVKQKLAEPISITAQNPEGINEAIEALGPAIRRINSVLRKVDDHFATLENFESLSQSIKDVQTLVASMRDFVRKDNGALYTKVVQPLNSLLTNANDSLTQLRERVLNETLTQAEAFLRDGRSLVADAREAIATAQQAIGDISPRASAFLDDADDAVQSLEARVGDVAQSAQDVLTLAKGAISEGKPDLIESLRRLRRTMWEAEMAMRKIRANPAYLLFGDDKTLLDAPPLDVGDIRSSGRARPYEQRDENDGGS